jgi:hypothetical protein
MATHDNSGRFQITTLSAFSDFSITSNAVKKPKIKKSESKFKQRRQAAGVDSISNKKTIGGRYQQFENNWGDKSSFLDSILNQNSSIFSIRSRKPKQKVDDVRKKIDAAWDCKAAVLYDADEQSSSQGKKGSTKLGSSNLNPLTSDGDKSTSGIAKINNEISAFLKDGKSSFCWESSSIQEHSPANFGEMPNFKLQNKRLIEEEKESEAPTIPDMSVVQTPAIDLPEKFNQICMISEIFQPSEDDLAERILSSNDDPFNLNFNLDTGTFEVNLEGLPKDGRNTFFAKEDFE